MELNTQIAEFSFPFPSKIFEEELIKEGITFRCLNRDSFDGGVGSSVFYINSSDFEKAFQVRERVEKENVVSELKHMHPFRRFLNYFLLGAILIYGIYKLYRLSN